MKIGSLFSGLGGLEMGLEWAAVGHTVWQCEQNTAAQAVLRRHWPGVPVYSDVRTIGASNVEPVDVLCGGFPCQDISVAGNGAGLEGARSGLWFEYLRLIRELRPRYVVAENVGALRSRGLDVVLGGLAESGYDALWLPIRASDVGAPHRRERIFIVAWRLDVGPGRASVDVGAGFVGDTNGARLEIGPGERGDARTQREAAERAGSEGVGDADEVGRHGRTGREPGGRREPADSGEPLADVHEWPPGPNDGSAWADYLRRFPRRAPALRGGRLNPVFVESMMGLPENWTRAVIRELGRDTTRAERLEMCGNAVVPQCAEVVGHVLRGMM